MNRCVILQNAKKVIGIELVQEAVTNAQENAKVNGNYEVSSFSCEIMYSRVLSY